MEIDVLRLAPHHGHARRLTIPATLEQFQSLVGGLIQHLPLRGGGMYFHEEGKLVGLDRNPDADAVLRAGGTNLLPGDYIVGVAILVGPYDDDGYDTSVTPELVEVVRSAGLEVL